ncbi:hypothetical protein H0H87_011951 [Tephrocybe sp. NHM501043]|nr:hypothetical protein H0H87_011951 [Tephrocybe sp. NHM501043]
MSGLFHSQSHILQAVPKISPQDSTTGSNIYGRAQPSLKRRHTEESGLSNAKRPRRSSAPRASPFPWSATEATASLRRTSKGSMNIRSTPSDQPEIEIEKHSLHQFQVHATGFEDKESTAPAPSTNHMNVANLLVKENPPSAAQFYPSPSPSPRSGIYGRLLPPQTIPPPQVTPHDRYLQVFDTPHLRESSPEFEVSPSTVIRPTIGNLCNKDSPSTPKVAKLPAGTNVPPHARNEPNELELSWSPEEVAKLPVDSSAFSLHFQGYNPSKKALPPTNSSDMFSPRWSLTNQVDWQYLAVPYYNEIDDIRRARQTIRRDQLHVGTRTWNEMGINRS